MGIPSAHRGRHRACLRVYASLRRRAVPNPCRLHGRRPACGRSHSRLQVYLRDRHPGERTSNISTCMNPREGMCLCSFRSTRNPGTPSNASSRSVAPPSKRRWRALRQRRRGQRWRLHKTCAPPPPLPLRFSPSARLTFCPTTTLLPITNSRPNSSMRSFRTGCRSKFRKGTSSPWATIASRAATAAPGAPSQ